MRKKQENENQKKTDALGVRVEMDNLQTLQTRLSAGKRIKAICVQMEQQQAILDRVIGDLISLEYPTARLAKVNNTLRVLRGVLDDEAGKI